MLGQTVVTNLFGTDIDPIGKWITIGGTPFTVIGVLKSKGSTGFQDADDMAVAPLTTVQQSFTGYGSLQRDHRRGQERQVDRPDAQTEITSILDTRHKITSSASADFRILNQASLLTASTSTSKTFTVLLGAVAAISLLVGGIGITNIMLVTVTERTREIGIRKAIGAPRGAILGQFLTEATLLSLIGGALGVARRLRRVALHDRRGQAGHRPELDRAGLRRLGRHRPVLRRLPGQPGGIAATHRRAPVRVTAYDTMPDLRRRDGNA